MPKKMHSNRSPKLVSFGLKTLSAAVISAMLCSHANAAGLGKLTVLSSLGQPLHAEIELNSVSGDEAGALVPKLASPEAYQQANVEFQPALLSLRFALERRGGKQLIRVTSSQPINEPFVDMLIELDGEGSRLVREYTFLLDPADLHTGQAPAAAAMVLSAPSVQHESKAPAAPQPEPSAPQSAATSQPPEVEKNSLPPRPAAEPSAKHAAPAAPLELKEEKTASDTYTVKSGDYLAKIATQVMPQGVSLDQMLVALYRSNPKAFVGKNMNRLRAGQILSVPAADEVRNVGSSEAKGVVLAQASDFNQYRNKLAGHVEQAEPQHPVESSHSATGKITAKVEEHATPASESKDKLKLSKAGAAAGKNVTEESIAKDKALAEANSRVKELEKNVADLQKLLELKNHDLAERQRQLELANAKAKTVAAAEKMPPVPVAKPMVAPTPVQRAPEPKVEKHEAPAPVAVAVPKPVVTAAAPKPPVVKPKAAPVPQPLPRPEASDDSTVLYGGILGLAALLIGGGLYVVRRKRKEKRFEDSIITDSSLKANSLFGSTGGQSVDTNNSVFNSSFAPSANQLDSNEVDPVAEADVYIAYGRDAQAEEILKEALRTQPERNAVRLKLLEIYANRKDKRSFETLASELYSTTKGEGEDWKQAAALGLGIDPDNPLYAAGKDGAPVGAAPAAAAIAASKPADEPDLDALLDSMQPPAVEQPRHEAPRSVVEQSKTEEAKQGPSSELDFDLDGLGINSVEVPNTIPRPMHEEPKLDLGDINFDFLGDTKPAEQSAPAEPKAEAPKNDEPAAFDLGSVGEFSLGDVAVAEAPAAVEAPAVQAVEVKPKAEPADLDLSGLTLELNPGEAGSGLVQEAYGVHDTSNEDYSASAEMATKLDLAVAYQEIGDKEGARELLDEVVKGGTAEQSEKAKALLLKIA